MAGQNGQQWNGHMVYAPLQDFNLTFVLSEVETNENSRVSRFINASKRKIGRKICILVNMHAGRLRQILHRFHLYIHKYCTRTIISYAFLSFLSFPPP